MCSLCRTTPYVDLTCNQSELSPNSRQASRSDLTSMSFHINHSFYTPIPTMLLRRSAIALSRRAAARPFPSRTFTTSLIRSKLSNALPPTSSSASSNPAPPEDEKKSGDPSIGQSDPHLVPFEGLLITFPPSRPTLRRERKGRERKRRGRALADKLLVEVKSESDLLPPGAAPGTMPSDLEQATGLERLEILGKMQGIDIFDMRPLDSSRTGMCALAV